MLRAIERLLSALVLLGALLFLFAALSLPIACPFCLKSVLLDNPVAQTGDIKVFAGSGSQADVRQVLEHIPEARRRVESLFGPGHLRTDIVIAPRQELANDADFAGAMTGSLLGPAILMLPDDTLNLNVTAHEMVHAYLHNRIGHWRTETDMPQWFNEGLAMQVDASRGFGPDVLCRLAQRHPWPTPEALAVPMAFYNTDQHSEQVFRYAWSKGMVWHMLSESRFASDLERFFAGESWQQAFADYDLKAISANLVSRC